MANFLDKAIGYLNPKAGAQRVAHRKRMEILEGMRGYEGASNGRLAQGWRTVSSSADSEIAKAGQSLRDRSRDLVRNNPLAAKIVSTHANNFFGFGIIPRAKTGDKKKDKLINELFEEWSKKAFVGHGMNFYGGFYTASRMMVQDGELYIRKRLRLPTDGFAVPLQIELLDAEYCDWSKSGAVPTNPGNKIKQGVEFDAINNRRGYWMFPQNPKSGALLGGTSIASSFVSAEDIVHLYEPQTNQVHGVPWLAPVMTELRDLKDYELAENIRKKVESCLVGLITPGEDDASDPNIGLDETLQAGANRPAVTDIYGNAFERMEPGMFGVLNGGKSVTFNTPAISAGIETYIRTRLRSIAAGVRMPYALMTGDFSQENFASGKLGILEYQRFVSTVQWHYLIPMGLEVVWGWFIDAAKAAGKIPANTNVKVEWTPPEFESVTRLDDARADLLEVRMGKRSMPEIISKTGRDPKTVLDEIDEWNTSVDTTKSGVILDTDPRKVAINGQLQWQSSDQNGDKNGQGP
jgi:lambda family phage portal protein